MLSASVHLLKSKSSQWAGLWAGESERVRKSEWGEVGEPLTTFHFDAMWCCISLASCLSCVTFFSEAHLKNDLFCSS